MSFSSNSVIAKSRAVFGRLLTAEDYAALCSKATVSDAAAFLRQTERFHKVLAGIDPQTIHRGQLEALLQRSVFDIFESFHKFDHSTSRLFFKFIVDHLVQEQLLRCIEGIAAGSADNYISMLPGFVIEHSDIDLLELGKARSLLEIDERLTGTVYGRILRPLLIDAAETGRLNISECERRLYTSYYTKCIKKINSMYKGTEKTELKRAMLKSIDLVNVVTCCRMKAFAGSTPQMIHASLLPLHYRLNDQTIERLIQISDFSKLEAELAAIGYRTDSSAQTETVEQLTERISLSFFRRSLRLSQSSAVVYFSLQECLKIEQRNIKTAIEGIRYGLTSSEILEMLVI